MIPRHAKGRKVRAERDNDFLIQIGRYKDGVELYRHAATRFPRVAFFHQGWGCCAGHQGLHREAISASQAALAFQPDNQKFVNDLGWSLYQAGRIEEARTVLEQAVVMDKTDPLAAENLRIWVRTASKRALGFGR
jgi:Flp pilus assembly protein TadD